jgi:hypothetical protein
MQTTYTPAELDAAALADLISDAESAERQAARGPFYPDRGITRETLTAYARKCRERAERYRNGGAHNAVVTGK